MCRLLAPRARLSPISEVRSSTLTRVVFAMPMVPMRRVTPARLRNKVAMSASTPRLVAIGSGGTDTVRPVGLSGARARGACVEISEFAPGVVVRRTRLGLSQLRLGDGGGEGERGGAVEDAA